MTAKELTDRKAAADKDPSLYSQLLSDVIAHKDKQLSDLTTQVNSANNARLVAENAKTAAERSAADATNAKVAAEVARQTTENKHAAVVAKLDLVMAGSKERLTTQLAEEQKQLDAKKKLLGL